MKAHGKCQKMESKVIVGIDLAGKSGNSTGWAVLKNRKLKTCLVFMDHEILTSVEKIKPVLIAIDAPFSLPKRGLLRRSEEEMMKKGYRIFSPNLPAMKMLTLRAMRLNRLILEKGFETVEVHPTSACKALGMPVKNWGEIQKTLTQMRLKGELERKRLTSHEIDAALAALTAYLYMKNETETLGNEEEGYIIVPKRQDWRKLRI
jgi:predicted nuclease with RNAse H fold